MRNRDSRLQVNMLSCKCRIIYMVGPTLRTFLRWTRLWSMVVYQARGCFPSVVRLGLKRSKQGSKDSRTTPCVENHGHRHENMIRATDESQYATCDVGGHPAEAPTSCKHEGDDCHRGRGLLQDSFIRTQTDRPSRYMGPYHPS